MTSVPKAEALGPARRWQFRLGSLVWLQLLVAPAFLSPFYFASRGEHATIALIASLVALLCYVSFLVAWGLPVDVQRRSPVLAAALRGAIYGAAFFLLAWGPVIGAFLVNERRLLETVGVRAWQADPGESLRNLTHVFPGFEVLGFFGIFLAAGALIGSVVALANGAFTRPQVRILNPQP